MTDLKSVKYDNDSKLLRQVPDANAVDAQLSLTSENAVQNKAIAAALMDKLDAPANAPQPGMSLGVGSDYKPLWVPSAGDAQRYAEQAQAAAAAAADDAETASAALESILAVVNVPVGNVHNLAVVDNSGSVSFSWTEPPDMKTDYGVTVARWASTRLLGKRTGYPEDENDGDILVDSDIRDQYRFEPFTVQLSEPGEWYFAIFIRADNGTWLTDDTAPRFRVNYISFATIQRMVHSNVPLSTIGLEIGGVVNIQTSTRFPALRWMLVDEFYQGCGFTDPSVNHCAVFIPQYLPCVSGSTVALQMQFDAPENSYGATWDTAFIQDKVYYRMQAGSYVELVAGTDYTVGGSVADWRLEEDDEVYTKNHANRVSSGNNIWKESNMRQWLNSAAATGWFTPQNEYDKQSTGYPEWGFLNGFDADLLEIITPVYSVTARNTVSSILGGGGSGHDETLDKIWLPSVKEIFGTNNNNIAEGAQFAYFRDVATTNASRIQRDESGTARGAWLRSPNPGNVNGEYYVNTGGSSNNANSSYSCAFLPAICLS